MERIELFDNYINNRLSDVQHSEFDEKLKNDEEFADEFRIYLMTVDGICREAHQNDIDFGIAMKKLTKVQLREIIGSRNETEEYLSVPAAEIVKPKFLSYKPWLWQVASIAAVIIIAFIAVFKIEQNSRNNVYDAIYAFADLSTNLARSGGESINVESMTNEELKNMIPTFINLYQTATDTDEIADNGYTLAMVYFKLHERDKAVEVLNQLISRFDGNEDYADSVNKWKSILNLIK